MIIHKKMHKKGLTLIEILVSSIILTLVVAGLVNVFISGRRYVQESQVRIQLAEAAKFYLEPLYMQVRQDQWAGGNCLTRDGNNPAGCVGAQVIDNATYTPTWTNGPSPINANLRKVTLTLSD